MGRTSRRLHKRDGPILADRDQNPAQSLIDILDAREQLRCGQLGLLLCDRLHPSLCDAFLFLVAYRSCSLVHLVQALQYRLLQNC
jgi:hypothetical protein